MSNSIEIPVGMSKESVLSRICWLAWQACGGPMGMGVLQDRPGVTEKDVAENISKAGDYPWLGTSPGFVKGQSTRLSADYVFGRMMKLHLTHSAGAIEVPQFTPRADYQAWCLEYPTYESLIKAAITSLIPR